MTPARPSSSARDWTMEQIYRLIQGATATTRSELIARTGLPSSTVSHAVGRLLEAGRVAEGRGRRKEPGSGSGRPARVLRVAGGSSLGAVISFGHRHVRVALGDGNGNPLDRSTLLLEPERSWVEAADLACDRLVEMCHARDVHRLSALVVGLAVGRAAASAESEPSEGAPGRAPSALCSHLTSRLNGVPVVHESRASLAAIAELQLGAGRTHQDFILVSPRDPAEAGIVCSARVYRGAAGLAGRLDAGSSFGKAVADACNLLNPTAVIVGAAGAGVFENVAKALREALDRWATPAIAGRVEILQGAAGPDAELVGGLLRASSLHPASFPG